MLRIAQGLRRPWPPMRSGHRMFTSKSPKVAKNKRILKQTRRQRKEKGEEEPSFTVAIVGRPNVGKSRLFNKLTGSQASIVDQTPNVTRDRKEGVGRLAGLVFRVIDTPGLEDGDTKLIEGTKKTGRKDELNPGDLLINNELKVANSKMLRDQMMLQTEAAMQQSDVVLFVLDGRMGVTGWDEHYAKWLRERVAEKKKEVVVVVNKCEGEYYQRVINYETAPHEFTLQEVYDLGFGEPVILSAEHGEGFVDLFDVLRPYEHMVATGDGGSDDDDGVGGAMLQLNAHEELLDTPPIRIAIIGRPNVGKSTMINSLLNEDRVIVADVPGVTRDAVELTDAWPVPPALRGLRCLKPRKEEEDGEDSTNDDGSAETNEDHGFSSVPLQRVTVVDTAGIYKARAPDPSKVKQPGVRGQARDISMLNFKTFRNTVTAVRKAHVVVMVVDVPEIPEDMDELKALHALQTGDTPVFHQSDSTLINMVFAEGRPLVVVINKWDRLGPSRSRFKLIRDKKRGFEPLSKKVARMPFATKALEVLDQCLQEVITVPLRGIECIPVSALKTAEVSQTHRPMRPYNAVWPAILRTYDAWTFRLPTAQLNAWLAATTSVQPPPSKIMYATQTKARPPTIILFARPQKTTTTTWAPYLRYLTNEMRTAYNLTGVPIRFKVKATRKGWTEESAKRNGWKRRAKGKTSGQGKDDDGEDSDYDSLESMD